MKKIHKGTDYRQSFIFNDFLVSEVANIYFLLVDPMGAIVKKMSVTDELPEFSSIDTTVINDTEVEVRLKRSETNYCKEGVYTFQVRVSRDNLNFEDSVEITSQAFQSFMIVADYEETTDGDSVDVNIPAVLSDVPNDGYGYVRYRGEWKRLIDTDSFKALVDLININQQAIAEMASASMKLAINPALIGTNIPTSENVLDFVTESPSNNPLLLTSNDTANTYTFVKSEIKYVYQTVITVKLTVSTTGIVTLSSKRVSDDSIITSRSLNISGKNGEVKYIPAPLLSLSNIEDNLNQYITWSSNVPYFEIVGFETLINAN